ncbi:beta/gamma crystallin-related protein [Microbispora sp. NBC_01189]|uniref:beta/gamma crystallin-related protein n=1 Tax=Microbispora sp. NBC_01189 TaxID=2903583 RepID=UPI002E0F8D14|nr:beta/gamma crystallin-related protein [Microbispora sp. NBC_01189]
MRRTLRTLLATAALATAAIGVNVAPAHAGWIGIILYEDSGYKGYPHAYTTSRLGLYGWWENDEASSVKNVDLFAWVLYDDVDYKDRHFCIRPGEWVENLGSSPWKFNDKISSLKRLTTSSCAGYVPFYNNA